MQMLNNLEDWVYLHNAVEEYISKHDKEIYIHNLNNDFYTGLFQTTCVGRWSEYVEVSWL